MSRLLRFNEHKLLLDPHAKAISGKCFNEDNLMLAYDPHSTAQDLSVDTRDNSTVVPKCIVIDDQFDWEGDAPPHIPLEKGIIYEVHLKGFTAHPSSRVRKPGTYLGFIEKIPYLSGLGITTVEFLPLHEFYADDFLLQRGLTNYWGYNSINFVTCHDGFTLRDLVSYSDKHNEANGENNNDGTNDNNSWNCGADGETDSVEVNQLRKQQIKNLACCLLFAAGTPMIPGGDEIMRTQRGNNNAYCQDNEISWFNWDDAQKHSDILEFFKKAIALTQKFTILQRPKFLLGVDCSADQIPDIDWFGKNLDAPAWNDPELRTICYRLDGSEEASELGDYWLFLILNADYLEQSIRIPPPKIGMMWYRLIDTSLQNGEDLPETGKERRLDTPEFYLAKPRSTVMLLAR